jgi:WD40 repeat protein
MQSSPTTNKPALVLEYNAFISYSHAQDKALAPLIQDGLRSFAKPWDKLEALKIFRDQTNLSAAPGLWPDIERALAGSEFFILLASPTAAASRWVKDEVDFWLKYKGKRTLLIALTSGTIAWRDGNFDWEKTNALPRNLDKVFEHEPKYADFTGLDTNQCTLDNPIFLEQLATLAAPLHRTHVGNLIGQQEKQHRRTLRIRNITIAVLLALLFVVGVVSWNNYVQSVANAKAVEGIGLEEIDPTRAYRKVLAAYHDSDDLSLLGIARNIFSRNETYSKSYQLNNIIHADYTGTLFVALLDSVTIRKGTVTDSAEIRLSKIISKPISIHINPQQSHFVINTKQGVAHLFDTGGTFIQSIEGVHSQFQFPSGDLYIFDSLYNKSIYQQRSGYKTKTSITHPANTDIPAFTNDPNSRMVMSNDGSIIVVHNASECLILDNHSLKRIGDKIPASSTTNIAVSHSGKYVAVSKDFKVLIFKADGTKDSLDAHVNYPIDLKFLAEEDALISTGMDYKAFIHYLPRRSSSELRAHLRDPFIAVAHDGKSFITYDRSNVFAWPVTSAPVKVLVQNNPAQLSAVRLSSSKNYKAAGDMDGRVWLWDSNGNLMMHETNMQGGGTKESRFAFSNDEKYFYYLKTGQHQIIGFDIPNHKYITDFDSTTENLTSIGTTDDGNVVAFSDSARFLKWDSDGKFIMQTDPLPRGASTLSIISKGKYLITSNLEGYAIIYDANGKVVKEYAYDNDGTPIQCADLSTDEKYLIMGSNDGKVKLIAEPLKSGRPTDFSRRRLGYVMAVRFFNKTSWVLTSGDDQRFRVWDNHFQETASVHTGTPNMVWDIDVSSDDREIITADDNSIKLWQVNPLEPLQ